MSAPSAAHGPEQIGRYTVVRELGRGGMGVVYEGVDAELDRRVAIKVLLREENREDLARFEREAQTVARLDHESIVRVFDVGLAHGRPYLVMEFVEGRDLHDALKQGIPLDEAVLALRDVAEALSAAHAAGIVHRDVKPENILIRGNTGRGALMDFGVAKGAHVQQLTQTGALVGTPDYMAPEQLDGEPSTASDVYALGATLYDILCGRPPFVAESMIALLTKITTDRVTPPSQHREGIPPALEALALACLETDQAQRPSAREVVEALDAFLDGEPDPIAARPALGPYLLAGGAVVILAASAGLAAWALTRAPEPSPTPTTAAARTAKTTSAPLPTPSATQPAPTPSETPAPTRTPKTRATSSGSTEVLGELWWWGKKGPKGVVVRGGKMQRRSKLGFQLGARGARVNFGFVIEAEGVEWVQARLQHAATNFRGQKGSEVVIHVNRQRKEPDDHALVPSLVLERRLTTCLNLTPKVLLRGSNTLMIKFVRGVSAYEIRWVEVRYGRGTPPALEEGWTSLKEKKRRY